MDHKVKNFLTVFFLAVGIIGLYFILKEYDLKEIISTYKHFNIGILALYIITLVALMIVLTWRWDVILKSRNIHAPFRKLFVYRIIGTSINFITPGPRVGGEPTQASLLTKHNVEFTEGLSTIMIDKIIDSSTAGLLFILGAFLVGIKYSFDKNVEIILIIAGILVVGVIVLFYYQMLHSKHFFLKIFHFMHLDKIKHFKKIGEFIEKIEVIMIEFYNRDKKHFITCILITILTWIIMFVEYKLATTLLGINVGIVEIFFIVTFIGVAMLFPIPMAVGVLEAGQISAFSLINLSANAGIALAFLVRLKDIIWAIIGIILLATYGFHIVKVVEKKYKSKNADIREQK